MWWNKMSNEETIKIEGINEKGEKFYIELGGPCPPVQSMFFPKEDNKETKGESDGNSSQSA